jgi:ABC-type antimicrobial peptide transport system permease subunit
LKRTPSAPWSLSRLPRERFGSANAAVDQTFEIYGIPFTIIGVFKESVDDMGQSEIADQTILIPYSVARLFTGTENVKQIYFSMRTMIRSARRSERDCQDYSIAPSSGIGV